MSRRRFRGTSKKSRGQKHDRGYIKRVLNYINSGRGTVRGRRQFFT